MHPILRRIVLLATACVCFAATAAQAATAVKPGISMQPAALTVAAGASATFSVTANGTATLKYQWQFNSANITGATKASYTIAKVSSANAGTYRVIVSNAAGSTTSNGALLTLKTTFAGKYNMAVISYNAANVKKGVHVNTGNSSGGALYGTSTVSGASPYTLAVALKGYLGSDQTGASQNLTGTVSSQGVVTINGTDSNLNVNIIKAPDGTPIGFLGTGTPKPGTDNSNDGFVLGVNASTTAPTSIAACVGTYTIIVIGYNATAVSKKNASQNDGDASIGTATVSSNGNVMISQKRYADGGGDTLGVVQTLTGKVSSSGVISSVVVQTGNGPQTHPVNLKFVTLNGQAVGFTGTFSPLNAQQSDSGLLIGIKNTSVKPL